MNKLDFLEIKPTEDLSIFRDIYYIESDEERWVMEIVSRKLFLFGKKVKGAIDVTPLYNGSLEELMRLLWDFEYYKRNDVIFTIGERYKVYLPFGFPIIVEVPEKWTPILSSLFGIQPQKLSDPEGLFLNYVKKKWKAQEVAIIRTSVNYVELAILTKHKLNVEVDVPELGSCRVGVHKAVTDWFEVEFGESTRSAYVKVHYKVTSDIERFRRWIGND